MQQNGDVVVREQIQRIRSLIDNQNFLSLMNEQVAGHNGWLKRLTEIETAIDRPPETRIAMIGSTGAGKSTLLNALLGAQILPVSSMKPCTAVVTSVRFAPEDLYRAEIRFLSIDDWNEELYSSFEWLYTEIGEEERSDLTEWNALKKATQDKIRTVYKLDESQIDRLRVQTLELPEDLHRLMKPGVEPLLIQESDPQGLRKRLKEYLTDEGSYWPIVKTVAITGPFDLLRGGAVLIDLPGVNDPNQAREEVTRKYLRDASYIWVVFNMKRGVTKDIRDLLAEQKMLRQFLYEGKINALTMVGTHADEFNEDVTEELGLSDDAETMEIIQERNKRVKKQVKKDLHDIAGEIGGAARESGESLLRLRRTLQDTSVFTVSTPAYMKAQNILRSRKDYGFDNIEKTGLPDLIQHIEAICRSQDYVAEVGRKASLLLGEIESFFRSRRAQQESRRGELTEQLDQLHKRLEQPRKDLDAELDRARERCEESFKAHREVFEERLKIAIETAQVSVNRILDSWVGIHWATLKAAVGRKGEFLSPSSGKRYDLNEDIAEPLLKAIPFVWDDFFGHHLETSLAELKGQLQGRSEVFLERLKAEARIAGVFEDRVLNNIVGDIEVSRRTLEFQVQETITGLERTIATKRADLSSSIAGIIKARMKSSYDKANQEKGSGMKNRILKVLKADALQSVKGMYETIQNDLLEGIIELGEQFAYGLKELHKHIGQQADRVMANLGGGSLAAESEDAEELITRIDSVLSKINEIQPQSSILQ